MITMDKTYKTEQGNKVRIYAVDGGGVFPVHGAVQGLSGEWHFDAWREDGTTYLTINNLIEVVMIPEYWVVFEQNGTCSYVTNNEVCVDLSDNLFSIHHPAQEKPHV